MSKNQYIEEIELLEHRIEVLNNKINNTTNQKQLDVLNDSKNELNTRLQNKIIELNNINQRIRDIKQYGGPNPFDFHDIEQDNEIDLKKFLDITENNVVIFENDSIYQVFKNIKDGYPFILKGEIRINDNDPSMINAFFKEAEQLDKRIEKINEHYDESLTITFTGELIKYTKIFDKVRRSNYGTGCDSFKKIIEYRGNLCYIPEENECFRKCLEFIYKKDFSQKYREFIRESQRNKNIMTSAKIQPFCKKHDINLGIYDLKQKRILPLSVTERRICLYIHENHFCVIWKTEKTTFIKAIKELEDNFEYEPNHITDNILKQVQEYKFPISNEKDCLFAVFSFEVETVNVPYQEFCEAYGAGCYHLDRLKECYNGDLTKEELEIGRQYVHIFDRENNNPVLDMIKYIISNYEGKPKYFKDKNGEFKISSYRYQLIGHNASGFDNDIVLNSLLKEYTNKNTKIMKTSRGFLKLTFRVGSVSEDGKETPQYMKIVCSKVHIPGSLKKIQKEYNVQPQLIKGEIDHNLITLSNYKEHENIWKPYLIDDVLGLAVVVAKHGNKIQKLTGVSFKNSLTESSLAWSTLGRYIRESGKSFYTPKNKYVRDFVHKTVHGGRVVALNHKFVSTSFSPIVNILRKYFGEEHEISTLFEIYFCQIDKVKRYYTKKYENKFDDNRKINKQHFENYIKKNLSSLPISKELNKIDKSDLLVSSYYNSLYPSAMAHLLSMWPAIETAKAINPEDSEVYCKLFNTGEWVSLNKTGFFKVKYHNPENLILQHMAVKEDVYNDTENKYENVNRFRNGDITQHLTSVDIEEVVRVGGVIKKFHEGFICDNLDYNPFREYILDMTAKRNEYKKRSKTILADLCKKISNGTYG